MTNTVHYLENGGMTLRFSWRKQEYMIPIVMILKALTCATDKEIFQAVIQGDVGNTFLTDRIEMLLRGHGKVNSGDKRGGNACLEDLGARFRVVMGCPEEFEDDEVGANLIERCILVHLDSARDKFNLLTFIMRKLYSFVAGECCSDNPDSPQHQEVLLPGFLYGQVVKERLDEYLSNVRAQFAKDFRMELKGADLADDKYVKKVFQNMNHDVGVRLASFLATGNLSSPSGLDLQQTTGFTIGAEKLNFYRFISHFRCIHRGAFFAQLKTTTVRKLLPEAWGFLCPVHTPDGTPCGLLNHLSHSCRIITRSLDVSSLHSLLSTLGMSESFSTHSINSSEHVSIQLDGKILGSSTPALAQTIARTLRIWKTEGKYGIPMDLEIGFVPTSKGGQYPGLYLFSSRSRMMRPVKFLNSDKIDMIGPFEQVYLNVACSPEEIEKDVSTHVEFSPTNVLSVIANLTPFSDFNQSPRNMYQCQMGKQTMGTPSTNISRRTDNKLYRIQNVQTPVVRPFLHNKYSFDEYPNGCNAIVAVISYTGYDMEDAMILNKSSHERGFGYGSIYKSEIIDLRDLPGVSNSKTGKTSIHFGFDDRFPLDHRWRSQLEPDGLPSIGTKLKSGVPLCAYYDETSGKTSISKFKGDEECYVDTVRLIGNEGGNETECTKIQLTLRVPRSPVIGDKFSSRHGQKGVCSQKWPAVDMPFSESGMQPDVIINPHAFPSRMTIGMLIESMAGKAGAMHGIAQDSTPWT